MKVPPVLGHPLDIKSVTLWHKKCPVTPITKLFHCIPPSTCNLCRPFADTFCFVHILLFPILCLSTSYPHKLSTILIFTGLLFPASFWCLLSPFSPLPIFFSAMPFTFSFRFSLSAPSRR